jgi:hypothetical protein
MLSSMWLSIEANSIGTGELSVLRQSRAKAGNILELKLSAALELETPR